MIAIAHKHGTANQTLLKDAFASVVRGWLDKAFIVDALQEARAKNVARYENLLALYFAWGGDDPKVRRVKEVDALATE